MTAIGKLMWEQRVFEVSGNWKAAERVQEKISEHLNNIQTMEEGEDKDDEKCQH